MVVELGAEEIFSAGLYEAWRTGRMAKIHSFLLVVICLILLSDLLECRDFDYKRYPFRKKQRHVSNVSRGTHRSKRHARRYINLEEDCARGPCARLSGLEQIKCSRKCVSPACYKELYEWDELEEGEIDVRLDSFKGCVVAEIQDKEGF
ncbi:uncharacterized protein LOC116621171 [Nematostella vectensis]|uniref:uncharacterized protein LOC116621171 n=1 Tax=Nematostella vectensis TaxID=45351 RepID=UPI0020772563|nr:uncharacterized protein LOC116621171 [Nematostella vectensis]